MMDLKEIIKWFIPCFHILTSKLKKVNFLLSFLCIFLILNPCKVLAKVTSYKNNDITLVDKEVEITKNVSVSLNSSEVVRNGNQSENGEKSARSLQPKSLEDISTGRTFGRPFKKMMAGLMPIIFQIGAASTWAVVTALVGVKTLVVTLVILKILLVAGAAKLGALFGSKGHEHHSHHGWDAPAHQKEIHLHIHNDKDHYPTHHEEHVAYSPWSREGVVGQDSKAVNIVWDPYRGGPQTISTPFGNYVKIDPSSSAT